MLRPMELILAILGAGPIGFFIAARRRALVAYLCLWAVVFPVQTIVVFSESDDNSSVLYWVFNALILALGIGLNRCGAVLAERRRANPRAEGAA
jgi:peptidoglycan/LPS O-acetylase OafA/YrhL